MPRKIVEFDEINNDIGENIKQLRIGKGMSRRELGDVIKVSHQQLYKYELGTNKLSACKLPAIAKALGVPVSSFYIEQEQQEREGDRLRLEINRKVLNTPYDKLEAVNHLLNVLV